MSLRDQAAVDLQTIVEDAAGFGCDVTIVDPNGASAVVRGQPKDIHFKIDPETGATVSGRSVSVSFSLASLAAAGLDHPRGISNTAAKPWVLTFDDIEGVSHSFKVSEAMPDRSLGCIVCELEIYKP